MPGPTRVADSVNRFVQSTRAFRKLARKQSLRRAQVHALQQSLRAQRLELRRHVEEKEHLKLILARVAPDELEAFKLNRRAP